MKAHIEYHSETTYTKTFEFTSTGEITIPENSTCDIILVGGGGGGAHSGYYNPGIVTRSPNASGGSGALIKGITSIEAGTYTITVGGGGYASSTNTQSSVPRNQAGSGGSTSAFGNTAGGGGGAYTSADSWSQTANNGGGGTATVVSEGLTGSNGWSAGGSRYGSYGGCGSGSGGYGGSASGGQQGYAKIVVTTTTEMPDDWEKIQGGNYQSKLSGKTQRTYYKNIYTQWTQPILSENGTVGGNSFAVAYAGNYTMESLPAYKAVDGNNATFCQWRGANSWYLFYNPIPLKLSTIYFKFYNTNMPSYLDYLEGSNDGANWTRIMDLTIPAQLEYTLEVNTDKSYKYFRLYTLSNLGTGSWIDIYTITLNATEHSIIDATEDDYDFYKDKIIYHAINL